jgi:hypothetical protein
LFGFTAWFKLSTVDKPASMDDYRFKLGPPMGQFLSSDRMANLSDDEGFRFRKFLTHPKQEIDLTFDDDDDDDEDDAINVYRVLPRRTYHGLPFGKVRLN